MINKFMQFFLTLLFLVSGSVVIHAKEIEVKVATTSSGIKFYYIKSDVQDKTVISFAFPGGSAHDLMKGPMTTFVAANLMVQSAGGIKVGALTEDLNDIGGGIVLQPDAEYILGAAIAPSSKIAEVAKMANRVLLTPDFDKKTLEVFQKQLARNLEVYRNRQEGKAIVKFASLLSKPHPYGVNFIGDPARIRQIKRADLVNWHNNRVVRNGLIVSVVGNISEEKMAESVDILFAGLPEQGKLPPIPQVVSIPHSPQPVHLKGDNKQAMVIVGGLSLHAKDPYAWSAAVMLRNILASGQKSRLFKSIREETGKTYGIQARLQSYSKTGTLAIFGLFDKNGLDDTVQKMLKTIKEFRDKGPNDKEIEAQLAFFRNLDAKTLKDHARLAGLLNKFLRYGWNLEDLRNLTELNDKVDLKDPKFRQLLLPENPVVLVVE